MVSIKPSGSVKVKSLDSTKLILVVDSDSHIQFLFKALFHKMPVSIESIFADCLDQAQNLLNNKKFDLVIADEQLIPQYRWSAPILWMGDKDDKRKNYLKKPFGIKEIQMKVEKLLYSSSPINIIGPSIRGLLDQIEQIASYDVSVLLTGESGTGKELVAHFIHQNSPRSLRNFTTVHCGAISENLIESEFFGHKKGSFTGAVSDKKGFFEISHAGTLFLDELGDLPLPLQAKLLRAVQDKKIRPVGSSEEYNTDVRIISATNRNLEEMIQKKVFREDLFHRLAVLHFNLPPLRERKEDILVLVERFLEQNKKKYMKPNLKFSPEAFEYLQQYEYPGNIRELANVIEKAVLFSTEEVIVKEDLYFREKQEESNILNFEFPSEGVDLAHVMRQAEKKILSEAIHRSKGNRKKAAQLLKITSRSLKHRIHKYKLA